MKSPSLNVPVHFNTKDNNFYIEFGVGYYRFVHELCLLNSNTNLDTGAKVKSAQLAALGAAMGNGNSITGLTGEFFQNNVNIVLNDFQKNRIAAKPLISDFK